MKTPRQRFQETEAATMLLKLVNDVTFIQALDAAMLQVLSDLPTANDNNAAIGNSFRIDGARRFMASLITLPIEQLKPDLSHLRDNLEP